MPKVSLSDVASGYNLASILNANTDALQDAIDNTLSRDGSSPNAMGADLDMNSNRIINLESPQNANDAARWVDVTSALALTDTLPAQTGNSGKYIGTNGTVLSWSYPSLRVGTITAEISEGITITDYSFPPGDVRRYGCDVTGVTECGAALQAALDVMEAAGGGVIRNSEGGLLKVAATLDFPSNVYLDLNGGFIKFTGSNTPAIVLKTNATRVKIGRGIIQYVTPATTSDTLSIGVQLSRASSTTYLIDLEELTVLDAYRSYGCPLLTGCYTFLVNFTTCIAYGAADYGWYIQGDTSSGGCTNIRLDNCWVVQDSGTPKAESKGYAFRGVSQLSWTNIATDHIQRTYALWMENCTGHGQSFVAESCEFGGMSSGINSMVLNDGGTFVLSLIGCAANTVTLSSTAVWATYRTGSSTICDIHAIRDVNTTLVNTTGNPAADVYDTVYISGTGSRIKVNYAVAAGTSPALGYVDTAVPYQLEYFNGVDRTFLTGAVVYNPPSLANGAGTTTTVTVTGANIGDKVTSVVHTESFAGLMVYGSVTAANTVTVSFWNATGGVIDMASGTLTVTVKES